MEIPQKYTGLVYGEGRKEKKFLIALLELDKFKHHTKAWRFNYDNAHGCSAKNVLENCRKASRELLLDIVLCFVDLDDLKHDYPHSWEKEKAKLEKEFSEINIIWQVDNAEDEFVKVLGDGFRGKHAINKAAQMHVNKFINSDFWQRILNPIIIREKELDGNKT